MTSWSKDLHTGTISHDYVVGGAWPLLVRGVSCLLTHISALQVILAVYALLSDSHTLSSSLVCVCM